MISLASPMDKNLRAQVAETVSVIAGYEFPERWDGLVITKFARNYERLKREKDRFRLILADFACL